LDFIYCNLQDSFWAALPQHLPNLEFLDVGNGVHTKAMGIAVYLAKRSQHTSTPFRLAISERSVGRRACQELQATIDAWQLPNISLDVYAGDEEEQEEEEEEDNEVEEGSEWEEWGQG
jgi:hypothetical protein